MKQQLNKHRGFIGAVAVTVCGTGLPFNAWGLASFDAEARAELLLSENSGLSIAVTDTFFDIFETTLGDATTTAAALADPDIDATAGDLPAPLAVDQAMTLVFASAAAASSSASVTASTGAASILGTGILNIENQGADSASFNFDLNWDWSASVEHGDNEFAHVSLSLLVSAFDMAGDAVFSDSMFAQDIDTRQGDVGPFAQTGSQSVAGTLEAGSSWELVVDLFAVDGIAQSDFQPTLLPSPAPIALIGAALVLSGLRRQGTTTRPRNIAT